MSNKVDTNSYIRLDFNGKDYFRSIFYLSLKSGLTLPSIDDFSKARFSLKLKMSSVILIRSSFTSWQRIKSCELECKLCKAWNYIMIYILGYVI